MAVMIFPPTVTSSEEYGGIDFRTHVIIESNDEPSIKFVMLRDAVKMSPLLKDLLGEVEEDAGDVRPTVIPVPNVEGRVLAYVLAYMMHHWNNPGKKIPKPLDDRDFTTHISDWDRVFIFTDLVKNGVEKENALLFECMQAANFLGVEDLILLSAATAGSMMRRKTPDEIRDVFGIENDITPEQLAALRARIVWSDN